MKLNELNRYVKCRKELDVGKTIGFFTPMGWTVTDRVHAGYGSTGIEAAGALHRLSYGTREASVMM